MGGDLCHPSLACARGAAARKFPPSRWVGGAAWAGGGELQLRLTSKTKVTRRIQAIQQEGVHFG